MKIRTKFLLFTLVISILFSGVRVYDRVSNGRKLLLDSTISRTDYIAAFLTDLSDDYLERGRKAQLLEVLGGDRGAVVGEVVGMSGVRAAAPGQNADHETGSG